MLCGLCRVWERERERKIQTRSSLVVIRKRFCAEEGLVPGGGIFVFYWSWQAPGRVDWDLASCIHLVVSLSLQMHREQKCLPLWELQGFRELCFVTSQRSITWSHTSIAATMCLLPSIMSSRSSQRLCLSNSGELQIFTSFSPQLSPSLLCHLIHLSLLFCPLFLWLVSVWARRPWKTGADFYRYIFLEKWINENCVCVWRNLSPELP